MTPTSDEVSQLRMLVISVRVRYDRALASGVSPTP